MTTDGSLAALDLFNHNNLNQRYEAAYGNNPLKISIVKSAIARLTPGASVLDVGCGTGVPVSAMLADAGLVVRGFDIAPEMVQCARTRVQGTFEVHDMLEIQLAADQTFAAIFMIFTHLQLRYVDVNAIFFKFAQLLKAGGILVVGQMPADEYVRDREAFDRTGTWVQDFDAPFMGELLPTFMMTAEGQRKFLSSMGLEIQDEVMEWFYPDDEICEREMQQYIIARRKDGQPLKPPFPLVDLRE
ncbi:hypothetical protein MBLNU459_g2360t1 [Dothideomycetes sp. NU459]